MFLAKAFFEFANVSFSRKICEDWYVEPTKPRRILAYILAGKSYTWVRQRFAKVKICFAKNGVHGVSVRRNLDQPPCPLFLEFLCSTATCWLAFIDLS